MSEGTKLGDVTDFAENTMTPLEHSGEALLVIHQGGQFYVLPDKCTHANFPLHDGELLEGKIKCCYHGATFNLETGRPTLPAVKPIKRYVGKVEDGVLYLLED